MNDQIIESRIDKTELIKWKELQFIQQDNFKEWINNGSEKLIESIIKYQFIDPFKVWKHNGINYCLDGRHRYLDLEKVIASGKVVPDELPATFINCKNMKEAAELVLVYSSSYAKITQQGLFDFKEVYFSIIKKSVAQLKDNRFACFVVGDVRDKKGFYYNFVSDTIQAFKDAGMEYYNEIILVNVVGSLAVRVRRQFNGGRKVGKMHQNVLVFYKGDPKKIKENYPELNLGDDLESIADLN